MNLGTEDERLYGKGGNVHIGAGRRVLIMGGGGGGHGDPSERDPAAVLADVREGYVSPEAAAADYGVIRTPRTLAIDDAATQQRRTQGEMSIT